MTARAELVDRLRRSYTVDDSVDEVLGIRAAWYPAGAVTRLELPGVLLGKFLDRLGRAGSATGHTEAVGLLHTYVEEEIEAAGALDSFVEHLGLRADASGGPLWFAERSALPVRNA